MTINRGEIEPKVTVTDSDEDRGTVTVRISNASLFALLDLDMTPTVLNSRSYRLTCCIPDSIENAVMRDTQHNYYTTIAGYDLQMLYRYVENLLNDFEQLGFNSKDVLYVVPMGLILPAQEYELDAEHIEFYRNLDRTELNEEETRIIESILDQIDGSE